MKDSGETGINGAEGEAGSKLSGKRTGSGRHSGKHGGTCTEEANLSGTDTERSGNTALFPERFLYGFNFNEQGGVKRDGKEDSAVRDTSGSGR